MNSEIIPNNYANSNEMLYGAHYATLVSGGVSYENPIGKFVLSYATPNMNDGSAYSNTLPKNNTKNIVNKENLGMTRITASNYIELTVPKHFFYITDIKIKPNTLGCGMGGIGSCHPEAVITRRTYSKGQRFIVVNAGGNINSPCIVGVEG